MPKFLLTVFLAFTTVALHAQTWEIGGNIGGAGYMGDLNQHNPLQISGVSYGLFIKRNFNGYLALRGGITYGNIAAADSNSSVQQQRERNLSFFNKIKEASLIGEFNFFHYIPDAGKNWWTPYVYLGVGLAAHAPRTEYRGTTYGLRPLRTEGQAQGKEYSNYLISIPYGAGVKYNIGGKWTLAADIGYRYTRSDYIDDVSTVYPADADIQQGSRRSLALALSDRSGEQTGVYIGFPGTQRGDGRKYDQYLFLNLSISFTFVPQRCYYEQ